jgi:hypothetical protein
VVGASRRPSLAGGPGGAYLGQMEWQETLGVTGQDESAAAGRTTHRPRNKRNIL